MGVNFFVWILFSLLCVSHTIISKPSTTITTNKAVDLMFNSDYDARLSTKWNNTTCNGKHYVYVAIYYHNAKQSRNRKKLCKIYFSYYCPKRLLALRPLLTTRNTRFILLRQSIFILDVYLCTWYSWQFRPCLLYYHVDFRSIITPFRTNRQNSQSEF